jgi:hypothetical protein
MYKKILTLFVIAVLISSCSDDDETTIALDSYDQSVIEYFHEVALGFEFGSAPNVTRKWTTEMRIFVGGNKATELMDELEDVVSDINELATDGFAISIVSDTLQSNFYIFLGPGEVYAEKFPSQESLIATNWGLFSVYWDDQDQIYKGNMYVDTDRANTEEERHLLREELTQSLGLARDSKLYSNSIFQSSWTTTTEYSGIDEDVIRLLYHPQMLVGLEEAEAEEVLTQIILSEK